MLAALPILALAQPAQVAHPVEMASLARPVLQSLAQSATLAQPVGQAPLAPSGILSFGMEAVTFLLGFGVVLYTVAWLHKASKLWRNARTLGRKRIVRTGGGEGT